MIPTEVLFLLWIVLALLGFLLFWKNLRIALSNSMKNLVVKLMRITLYLYIAFGSMAIFTILIMPIKEHRKFSIFWGLHGLVSSKTWRSCHTELWFVWLESHQDTLYCFFGFSTSFHFHFFSACCLSFVYRKGSDLLELILYPATLLKLFISCRFSLVVFWVA